MSLGTGALRALAFEAQGLGGKTLDPVAAVERCGLVRTLGGSDVYLALWNRAAKDLQRSTVDAPPAAGELCVVPAVRGCIYLATREQAPWAVRVADVLSRSRRRREHEKVDFGTKELDVLAEQIVHCLEEQGALTTDRLRRSLPEGAIRAFGDIGKKIGLSSSLPPTLRELEFRGLIERSLPEGRLDSEKYHWRLKEDGGGAFSQLPDEDAELVAWLASQFLRWIGIVRPHAFVSWSGFGKRVCGAALSNLVEQESAEAIELEDGEVAFVPPGTVCDAQREAETTRGQAASYAFLPFEDNLIQLQGGAGPLVCEQHAQLQVPRWGQSRKLVTLGECSHLGLRAVVRNGELVGFWEVDPESGRAVTAVLGSWTKAAREDLDSQAQAAASFLLDEIGHALWFSIDREASMLRRCEEVRRLDSSDN